MKQLIFTLALLSVSLFYINSTLALTTPNQSTNIISAANPQFTLQLPSNPTTGYSWFLLDYNHNLLQLTQHKYSPQPIATTNNTPKTTHKMLVGAGGYEIWNFHATEMALKAPQITKIKLIYIRPWEIKLTHIPQNLKVKTIYVVIQ